MSVSKEIGEYRLKEERPIGKGSFGTVYKVYKNNDTEVYYAMKKVTLKRLSLKNKKHCREEAKWMREMQHENIVQFYDSFEIGDELYIVMEYCTGGSLKDYINKFSSIPEDKCLDIMKQICAGLRFLHDKSIIHRDIKTGNILLHDNVVKIGDLALAKLFDNPDLISNITMKVGTMAYMSPEMVAGKPYGFETDIWGLGCCMYEMAMRQMPCPGKTETEVENKITSGNISFDGFPYEKQMLNLLQRMLDKEPSNRPKIGAVSDEILAFIEKNSAKKLYERTQGNITVAREKTNALGNSDEIQAFVERNSKVEKRTQADKSSKARKVKNTSDNSGAQKQRFMATFPGNRPKTTENSESLLGKTVAFDVSQTELNKSARERRRKSKNITVYIPVKVSEDEYNMMHQADSLQQVLENKYLSSDELEKMFQLLESNMEERDFLDEMRTVIGNEKFKGAEPFLMSFWLFKTPLLRQSYKMACKKTDSLGV